MVAVVLTPAARSRSPSQPGARRPDLIGVVTFSGALGALVYALIKGNARAGGRPTILACLIGAAVLLIVFLIAELVQRDRAMFDLALFRKPTFTGGSIAAFALSAGLFALFLYLTLYLQDVLGYSALQTGLRLPGPLRRDPAHLDAGRPAHRARADPVSDRAGPGAGRRRPAADARPARRHRTGRT